MDRELPGTTEPVACTATGPPPEDDDVNDCRIEQPPNVHHLDREHFWHEFEMFVTRLAVKCNWHVHSDTCFKQLKGNEPRSDGHCRMRMNGKTWPHTQLDDETLSIQFRRLHPWINNFNDIILFLLQSNMDIKYIGSGPAAKALVYYITKSDLKIHAGVQTLGAALNSHAVKFDGDSSTPQSAQDRNLTPSVSTCLWDGKRSPINRL